MGRTKLLIFKVIVLYITLPFILFLIPGESLDYFPSICLFKNLFGIECPGCGITRAVLSLIHLKFSEALTYNMSVVIVFPVIVYLFIKQFILNVREVIKSYS